ncbi:MAG: hydrogenase expression/formation protein HypE [bacterium]
MSEEERNSINCPIPAADSGRILMAHGGGGRLMHRLIADIFAPAFANPELQTAHDAAVLAAPQDRLAFTTDSFVVKPLFFPGSDIGALAVNGTVNDLAMAGAKPLWLSVGFILEEGLPISDLKRVVLSMKEAALIAGVSIVTGDTKVVERGKCDGLYINTAGIGSISPGIDIGPQRVSPGDLVLLNGDIGRHGIAVLSARVDLGLSTSIKSDCASLAGCVEKLVEAGLELHCLRDLTRGGLATSLLEIAAAAQVQIQLSGENIPIGQEVQSVCDLLGYDPLYVANEGRFVTILPEKEATRAKQIIESDAASVGCQIIGRVLRKGTPEVSLLTPLGAERLLTMLSGEQLPRIC